MRILILGGSNTSANSGWAYEFARLCPEHHVDNRFLGAVGSLFGLVRLLKMTQEGAPAPDLAIVEYTLNDSLWLAGQAIDRTLVVDTLHDIVTWCAARKIPLLFLCLCVRPNDSNGESEGSRFTDRLYASVAADRGVGACLMLHDILGRIDPVDYADPMHLTPEAARKVAAAVADRLARPFSTPRGARRPTLLRYLDVEQARAGGAMRRVVRKSRVFEGPFVELSHGGWLTFRIDGRPLGFVLRSLENSGHYRIRADGRAIRKNAYSLARNKLPELLTLHYIAGDMPECDEVVVDMPDDETLLSAEPLDPTLMEAGPTAPYPAQTLEVNGVVFYRRRPAPTRFFERLYALGA